MEASTTPVLGSLLDMLATGLKEKQERAKTLLSKGKRRMGSNLCLT